MIGTRTSNTIKTLYDHEEDREAAEWKDDEDLRHNQTDESEAVLLRPISSTSDHPNNTEGEQQQSYQPPQQSPSSYQGQPWEQKSREWIEKISKSLPTWISPDNARRFLGICMISIGMAGILVLFFSMGYGVMAYINRKLHPVYPTFPGQSLLDGSGSAYNDTRPTNPLSHWPTDYTADIMPVHCHSHNDYWRPIPLITAIGAGCTGVEADVWQLGDELYVGHSLSALTAKRTFRSLYINPLMEILDRQNPHTSDIPSLKDPRPAADGSRNGVFDTDPDETLVLLVDFKPSGGDVWQYVTEQLTPLREAGYLSYFDGEKIVTGPVTVVATGEAPFDQVIANTTYRDIFYDAPLEALESIPVSTKDSTSDSSLTAAATNMRYDPTKELAYLTTLANLKGTSIPKPKPTDVTIYTPFNSYYASTSFFERIGIPIPFLRDSQRQKIQRQLAGAHAQGLKARYWETPGWPKALRNYIWRELLKAGVDFLNVDDVWEAARGDWGWTKRGVEADGNAR